MRIRVTWLLLLAIGLMSSRAPAQSDLETPRLAVPNSSKQGPALTKLKSDFKSEYAKREGPDQLALAKRFRELASKETDPNRQYVLLRESRELAVNAGDLPTAFAAIDDMTRRFNIDGGELKITAMTNAVSRSRGPQSQLMEQYLAIAEDALRDWDAQLGYQASRLATKLARESKDPGALTRAKQVELHVNQVNAEVKPIVAAANKLKLHPDDPDANLVVGQYWCFLRGVWPEGLAFLSKGADKHLAQIAHADLEVPRDPAAILALANEYWDIPDTKMTPKRRAHQRAAHWYEKALPQLNPDQKSLAQQRIAEAHADQKLLR